MKKIKIINNNNLPTIDFHKLKDLQKGFKVVEREELERLKRSIKKYGIVFPKYVWIDRGEYYIVDGHQTIRALKELEGEGYQIGEIPYISIKAKDKKEAIQRLLLINSKYGKINVFDNQILQEQVINELGDILEIPEMRVPDIINVIESEIEKLDFKEPDLTRMIKYKCPQCGFVGRLVEYKRVDKEPVIDEEQLEEIEDVGEEIP